MASAYDRSSVAPDSKALARSTSDVAESSWLLVPVQARPVNDAASTHPAMLRTIDA